MSFAPEDAYRLLLQAGTELQLAYNRRVATFETALLEERTKTAKLEAEADWQKERADELLAALRAVVDAVAGSDYQGHDHESTDAMTAARAVLAKEATR
jgi:hypothetical protein